MTTPHELPALWHSRCDCDHCVRCADELEAALARSSAEAVAWTIGIPTAAGVYRVRNFHFGHPEDSAVVEVIEHGGRLMCNLHCSNSENDVSGEWDDLANFNQKFEWQRIDAPPAAAGATEGWREFIAECADCYGKEVNGNRLSMRAKELLAAPQPSEAAQDDQSWDREAEQLTAQILPPGKINPNATDITDLFVDETQPLEQRARELLKTAWVRAGWPYEAATTLATGDDTQMRVILSAITAALSQPQGVVVDEAMVERAAKSWVAHQNNCRATTLGGSLKVALQAALAGGE